MISAQNLTKKYGAVTALSSLNLEIPEGEIFSLLGQNGAGKTTTINCFLGFTVPTQGDVRINNISVVEQPHQTKQHIAYIPENVMLYPYLTGIENLSFFSSLAGFRYSKAELAGLLAKAGLPDYAHGSRIATYSKGMRQKVGIAIAIAKKAKVLLLDEPTSGLDPKASNEFSEILKEQAKAGTAILMATHDIFRAKEVSHTIGIMKEGNLVSLTEGSALSASDLEQLYLKTIAASDR
jgi:ABC-2 type transport system ATP-binding protein